jgi:hypothetical protein
VSRYAHDPGQGEAQHAASVDQRAHQALLSRMIRVAANRGRAGALASKTAIAPGPAPHQEVAVVADRGRDQSVQD